MRLFVGIPLAETVRSELDRVVARIKPDFASWQWSQPESWHITVQFLGTATADQYSRLIHQLRAIRSPAVPLQLGKLDVFDQSGVFFADVLIAPELVALQKTVTNATAPCGFVAESRPYHPHITLARRKGGVRGRELRDKLAAPEPFSSFIAREFLLYESILSPGGSRYQVRGRFPLI